MKLWSFFILKLRGNTVGNYSITAVNMLSPLILLPILTNRYTKSDFAYYSLLQAVMAYVITVVDFGFPTSGTSKIAKINGSIYSYFITSSILRILLSVLSSLTFALLVLVKLFDFSQLTMLSVFIMAFSTAILPFWAINGRQESGIYAYKYIVLRIMCIGFLIICAWLKYDIELVILIYTLSFFIPAVYTFLDFYLSNRNDIIFKYRYFKAIFLNSIAMAQSSVLSIATNGSIIIAASFLMPSNSVAELSLSEKITRLALALIAPFAVSSLPRLAKAFLPNKVQGFKKLRLYLGVSALIYIFIGLVILFSSKYIYGIFGSLYENFIFLLIMLVWGLVSLINNFIGVQFFVINRLSRLYSRIFVYSFIIQIVLYIALGRTLGPIGVPLAVLITEVGLSITFFTIALSRIYGKKS